MPDKETVERAQEDARERKSPRETLNKPVLCILLGRCKRWDSVSGLPPLRRSSVINHPSLPGLSLCQKQQLLPQQIQVHQGADRKQLGSILLQSAIA